MEGCHHDNLVLWLDHGKQCRILKRFFNPSILKELSFGLSVSKDMHLQRDF